VADSKLLRVRTLRAPVQVHAGAFDRDLAEARSASLRFDGGAVEVAVLLPSQAQRDWELLATGRYPSAAPKSTAVAPVTTGASQSSPSESVGAHAPGTGPAATSTAASDAAPAPAELSKAAVTTGSRAEEPRPSPAVEGPGAERVPARAPALGDVGAPVAPGGAPARAGDEHDLPAQRVAPTSAATSSADSTQ
jgi:hypothetical protein